MPENLREKYIGTKGKNHQGYEMEVIEYNTYDNIKVHFLPPYEGIINSRMGAFKDGGIINPFAPSVCGVGIRGIKYPTVYKEHSRDHLPEYTTWMNMMKRCYNEKEKERCPTYKDVTSDERWIYYENFYEWLHGQQNYKQLVQQNDVNLDKDILIKGNKIYGPDTCVLVPRKINNLILKSKSIRGKYPIGVQYYPKNKKFGAVEGSRKNTNFLGLYKTPEEAFVAYKQFKEQRIKDMAKEEFEKGNITEKCYNALINYKVEITD